MTLSMFLRYNITSDRDKLEALRKTSAHLAFQATGRGSNVVTISSGVATKQKADRTRTPGMAAVAGGSKASSVS